MKIAVIDKKDIILKLENSAIKFEGQSLPLRLMDVLILNHRTTLLSSDIIKLTNQNITILLISHNNENISIVNSANTKNAQVKLQQYHSLSNRLIFAKYFVTKKIELHRDHLKSFGVSVETNFRLEQIKNATQYEALMGVEGAYAREYFKHYFAQIPKKFHKGIRSKQPPRDPVNALLSYWYSLYYNIITIKLLSHGLEPSMGYLHTPFRSHNALASDILELFRAAINQAVYACFKNELLTFEDFSAKGGVYIRFEGRKKVWKEFIALVNLLRPKLDEEVISLKQMMVLNEKI